jgi:mono/diheme cytochrome c family protein
MRHLAIALIAIAACGGNASIGPTGAECPPASTVSYDSFGRDFMVSYCIRCHDSRLNGADRHGAPEFHDFETLQGIRVVADHIDEYAGSGPLGTNTEMPPGAPRPSDEERRQLSEWIACGAPES